MNNLMATTKGTYTSLQIAEWTGKEHKNIMADIRGEIESLGRELGGLIFQLTSYTDKSNRQSPCYTMEEDGVMQLALKFDATTRYTVIQKLKENQRQTNFQIPQSLSESLLLASKLAYENEQKALQITSLETKIEESKPLVTFANTVLKTKDNILVRELAKIACDEGFSTGEKKLYNKLREWNMVMINSTEPYQNAINNGYFVVEERVFKTPYGDKSNRTTLVTPKGQVKIIEKLKGGN